MKLKEVQDLIEPLTLPYFGERYRHNEIKYLEHVCSRVERMIPGVALDVGPGYGTLAIWLADKGWTVGVVDPKPLGHWFPKELADQYEIGHIEAKIEDVELKRAARHDLVTMSGGVLSCVIDPSVAIERAIQGMRDDGVFICTVVDVHSVREQEARYRYFDEEALKETLKPIFKSVGITRVATSLVGECRYVKA